MDDQQVELYRRIQAFEFDTAEVQWPFSRRLARENRWSEEFALSVIKEYKKFAFLAMAAGHPVTPSDQVDQAWHLHLTYTRPYWEEFCAKALGKPLHHEPTQGGAAEKSKFDDWYGKTLASYERLFGHKPPEDIWPPPAIRFGRDLHFVRVNTQQHWLLTNPLSWLALNWRGAALSLLFVPLFLAGCVGIPENVNPMILDARDFLLFYGFTGVFLGLFAMFLRTAMSLPFGNGRPLELALTPEELAYLAGGPKRAVYLAFFSLYQRGCVTLDEDRPYVKSKPIFRLVEPYEGLSPLEDVIIRQVRQPGATFDKISTAAVPYTKILRSRLETLGLYVQANQSKKAQGIFGLLFLPLLIMGGLRLFHGIEVGKPVGYLAFLIFLVLGFIFFAFDLRRSLYGDLVLDYERRFLNTSTADGLLQAVAMVGLTALTDTALAGTYSLLTNQKISGRGAGYYDSGGGGGDGGGGDGGGGCGGCGGCGGG